MIALLQRVTSAPVSVSGERIAEISHSLLVLIGVEKHNLVLGIQYFRLKVPEGLNFDQLIYMVK